MKVLLLSAYHAASHKYWCDGLQKHFPDYSWTELALSPRYFAWRMRGNPLSWATRYCEILEQDYDLIVATSMVDLACLRGLMPNLGTIPALLYFHENQFAYPLSDQANSVVEAQLTSIYSALSAQKIVFNSAYNRWSFLTGVESLLRKFPDEKPADLLEMLKEKSCCLAVPLDLDPQRISAEKPAQMQDKTKHIVWNHRWEYDKGPDRLLALVQKLEPALPLCFHVVGQQFRQVPEVFSELKSRLQARNWLGTWGYIEQREEYLKLLSRADVVLSTALHDFQGLAMLEACALGCLPLAPARLAYPEFFPSENLYASSPENPECEANAAAVLLTSSVQIASSVQKRSTRGAVQAGMKNLLWSHLSVTYRDLFESTARVAVSCASSKNNNRTSP